MVAGGISTDTVQPEGGCIGRENDELDGRFYDNAMNLIYDTIPVPDKETIKSLYRKQANFTILLDLQAFVAAGHKTGVRTNLFKIGPLKILGDGALGARIAYLSIFTPKVFSWIMTFILWNPVCCYKSPIERA